MGAKKDCFVRISEAVYFINALFLKSLISYSQDFIHNKHIGLYAYRRAFLARFITLPRTPYEQAEALEQLRALEHGFPIAVGKISGWHSTPVDVPEDIAAVEARLAKE